MDALLFMIFAAIAVVCGINLVVQSHPISSALSLVGVMGALAALYLLLGGEFIAAAQRIRRLLESPEIRATREANLDQILVEGYVPGREVAVEGLLTDGILRLLAVFDKPDPLEGPYFEESIYVTPSVLPEAQRGDVQECAEESARAIGLTHGPLHAEFRINDEGVWPLEIAARPIGGLCARALRFIADDKFESDKETERARIGLEELLLRHAMNLPESGWSREPEASGVMMIPVPSSGILERIEGEEAAISTTGITELLITARLHDYIAAWPEGSSYLGFLFAKTEAPEEAQRLIAPVLCCPLPSFRLPLARYIRHRHRRRVQERLDDGFEFVFWDFEALAHGPIVRQDRPGVYSE